MGEGHCGRGALWERALWERGIVGEGYCGRGALWERALWVRPTGPWPYMEGLGLVATQDGGGSPNTLPCLCSHPPAPCQHFPLVEANRKPEDKGTGDVVHKGQPPGGQSGEESGQKEWRMGQEGLTEEIQHGSFHITSYEHYEHTVYIAIHVACMQLVKFSEILGSHHFTDK